MTFSANRKLHKSHESFWFTNGKKSQNFRILKSDYDATIKRLGKDGWKLMKIQPKGIFGEN